MIKKSLSALIIAFGLQSLVHAKVEAVIGTAPFEGNQNLIGLAPLTEESEIIISRDQYVVSYNKFKRSPNWVAWKLDQQSLGPITRTNNFQQDTDLQQYLTTHEKNLNAVNPDEYKGSCFDRGHQTPSADRTASTEDNNATFLMSNMAPQTPYLNRVIWEHLESYTRNIIKSQHKTAYIVTGPIYDEDFGSIGPKKDIKVPSKEFKIIFFLSEGQNPSEINKDTPSISVIMPNRMKDGSKPDFSNGCKTLTNTSTTETDSTNALATTNDWEQYKSTISTIENEASIKILKN